MRTLRLPISALVLVGALLSALVTPLTAVDLRDVLTDYTSTSWSRKDGLSGPVWAIAQDADGFLWLGTDDGLVRFDGMRFTPWEALGRPALPRLTVRALHLSRDGSLWVGFGAKGGVARITARSVRVYTEDQGVGVGAVTAMADDPTAALWIAGTEGLFRFSGDRWQRLGTEAGLPDAAATSVEVDQAGGLWVGTSAGVYAKAVGADRFQQVEAPGESVRSLSLSTDRAGRIWTSDPLVGFRPLGTPAHQGTDRAPEGGAGRGYRILHDRNGDLWVATIGQGLWRVRLSRGAPGPYIERATVLSGLSSDAVRSVFEDRDGNIWAGTTDGVDRLVPHRITPWTSLGLVGTLDQSRGGSLNQPNAHDVWVGTEDELIRFRSLGGKWSPDPARVPMRGARMMRADARGGLWVLTADDLFFVDGGRQTPVAFPSGTPVSWTEAVASDPVGGVWVAVIGGVILHDLGGRLHVVDRIEAIKDEHIAWAMADRQGRLWLAYSGSRVGVLARTGQFRSFGVAEGLGAGPYYAMHEDAAGNIWVAGASSLSRFDGEAFTSVTQANGLPTSGILALTEDRSERLWLATSAGIIRLAPREFDLAAASTGYQMHFRLYDTSDGLAGFPSLLGDRSAVRADDGTLWFVTSRGLSQLDPDALAQPHPTPTVSVGEVRANDRVVAGQALPSGTATLEIAYTAPELTYPLTTHFRYRLDGFDPEWVDAGTRRQALYTNLPPRAYSFRVAVSGDEGRWTEAPATLDFSIAPRFYQTLWFYPLLALSVGGLIALSWQLRLRQLRRQFSLVLGERVRLSRELHDTLLQSLVGVALEFDAVSKSIESSPATAKARVVKIREHVEEYIREARRSIWSLRSPALETGDLIEALRESAERATADQSVALAFEVAGTPRRLPSHVEHQVLRIGQEAVLNAVRHARATHVSLGLEFTPDTLVLRLQDDGVGFDPGRTAGGTGDHYGIITMRERAQEAGGSVTITSAAGHGTLVLATVPTAAAPAEQTQA